MRLCCKEVTNQLFPTVKCKLNFAHLAPYRVVHMNALWWNIIASAGLIAAAAPLLYILATTLAALKPIKSTVPSTNPRKIAILIPAHNETLLIGDTVRDAFRQTYPRDRYTVFVIADNCTDDTAALAREAGARVLERSGNPGKGQALNEAFKTLMPEDWSAFVVLDADSELHHHALDMLDREMASGAAVIQIRIAVQNPNDSMVTRAMELSQASFNALRPRGRAALGLSAGINGNGFCVTRDTIMKVPYLAHSIVEDIEYHMLLLKAGIRVRFLDSIWVKAQIPMGGRGARVQRVRWERGRIITIRNYAPGLFRDLLRGQPYAVDGLVDVLMPPVSLLALALLPALFAGSDVQKALAIAGCATLGLHYFLSALRYGKVRSLLLLSAYIPWYIISKTFVVLASLFTDRTLAWERTDRHKSSSDEKSSK